MRILYICHRFPFPPNRGGKIRPFHTIKHLHQNHDVTVASLTRSEEEDKQGEGLSEYCSRYISVRVSSGLQATRMFACLPTPEPSSMGYFYSPRLDWQIRQFVRIMNVDLIMVHCSSMAPYVAGMKGVPKILDFGDMDSQKWLEYGRFKSLPLSAGYWLEGQKLMRREKTFARQFDVCLTTTRRELQTLNSYGPTADTDWMQNGVDHEFFKANDTAPDPNTIIFVGRMDYYPNQECMVDFCRNTLPLLRARRPDVKLLIVGAAPSRQIQKLAELPGVTVSGSVPDVRPYMRRAAIEIAPLNIARGTQNKILEGMAMGVPVVCSELSAYGVDAEPGRHLLTASDPRGYAEAILHLLEDPDARQRLAKAAREQILRAHLWSSATRRLDRILYRCMIKARAQQRNPETEQAAAMDGRPSLYQQRP
jgi:polysaccharide biosynthesis protein PslH